MSEMTESQFITGGDNVLLFQYETQTGNSWVPNWSDLVYPIPVGTNAVPDFSQISPSGFNDHVDGMWIHPSQTVTICTDANYGGYCRTIQGGQFGSDGISYGFDLMDATAAGTNGIGGSATTGALYRNASSIQTTGDRNAWNLSCCRNETGPNVNPTLCDAYWQQGAALCGTMDCANLVSTNIGNIPKIATDSVCQQWCKNNPSACDTIKINFCSQNPSNSLCGCINDTAAAQAQRAQYPAVTAPRQCWPDSDCQLTDLTQSFIPTSLNPETANCPANITQQLNLNNDTIVGSTIDQTANLTTSNSIKTTTNTVPSTVTSSSSSSTLIIIFLIVFIVFIILGVSIYYLLSN